MNKAEIVLVKVIKPHRNAAEILQPRKQPLDLPSPLVSPECSSILCRCFYSIRFMRRYHLNALLLKFLIKWVTVVCPISYESLGLLVCKNFSESFPDKSDLMR